MKFAQKEAGLMTATSKAGDRIEIRRVGVAWKLSVFEASTGAVMHTHEAKRMYLCCQEACRYFGVGAFADPGA